MVLTTHVLSHTVAVALLVLCLLFLPDNMQVGEEEVVRFKLHPFRLPSLEVPIHICLRAKVPHIYPQPSKVCGIALVATIIARMTSLTPPTIHSGETAARNERMLAALSTYVCY